MSTRKIIGDIIYALNEQAAGLLALRGPLHPHLGKSVLHCESAGKDLLLVEVSNDGVLRWASEEIVPSNLDGVLLLAPNMADRFSCQILDAPGRLWAERVPDFIERRLDECLKKIDAMREQEKREEEKSDAKT